METMLQNGQVVSDVHACSPAERAGLHVGDTLLTINGEAVLDVIDYEYLTASDRLRIEWRDRDGKAHAETLQKDENEPLGLSFATGLMSPMRTCRNHCVFCFIDQMPKGVRTSLHVKDDDWRMSFIMGNYVSLTNTDDSELTRIIERRVSPLYISLHASDPKTRVAMMQNPNAGRILEQLIRLKDAGLTFHLQIVLCPGLNDGDILLRSIRDTAALFPAARSLAVVPVGLTRFREGLTSLRRFTSEACRDLIDTIEPLQADYLARLGTRFVFLSDEWYLLGGRALPSYEACEDFAQIENGVGLIRTFEDDFNYALGQVEPLTEKKRFLFAGGTLAEPHFRYLSKTLAPYNIAFETRGIRNDYFGEQVNVAGLITGGDLIKQLCGQDFGEALLIPRCMLKADEDVFLDGVTLEQVANDLQTRINPVSTGEELVNIMFGRMV